MHQSSNEPIKQPVRTHLDKLRYPEVIEFDKDALQELMEPEAINDRRERIIFAIRYEQSLERACNEELAKRADNIESTPGWEDNKELVKEVKDLRELVEDCEATDLELDQAGDQILNTLITD